MLPPGQYTTKDAKRHTPAPTFAPFFNKTHQEKAQPTIQKAKVNKNLVLVISLLAIVSLMSTKVYISAPPRRKNSHIRPVHTTCAHGYLIVTEQTSVMCYNVNIITNFLPKG